MALVGTSSTSIVFSSSNSRTEQGVQFSSSHFQPSGRSFLSPAALNLSRKRSAAVKALNAEPKRNDSIVPSASTVFAPVDKAAEVEDIEKLAQGLEKASPLESYVLLFH